jgi:hypothetical protein
MELRSMIRKTHNSLDGFNSVLYMTENRIIKLEDRSIQLSQKYRQKNL